MDINIGFSLELLRGARRDAKAYNVEIPRGLVALQAMRDQWFVQGKDDAGEYVSGDNAYEARANYIIRKIDQAHPQLERLVAWRKSSTPRRWSVVTRMRLRNDS